MKKAILFIWFGDEKPKYINWSLENFRRMNPGWDVRYVEYSNEQLKNYKEQNDPVLAETSPNKCFSYWVDDYKRKYLAMHKDEFVIYCDLDCFPIAPFDDFILREDANVQQWIKNNHPNEHTSPILRGCNWFRQGGYQELIPDVWCLSNNTSLLGGRGFMQMHKGSVMDNTLIIHNAMFMNESKIPEFEKRRADFYDMKIELGDNFCLPQFTPIEHYYSFERNKLNKTTS